MVRALGSWTVNLSADTPQWIVDLLDSNRFGRIVVDAGRDNPAVVGDALLASARYVGVLRGTERQQSGVALTGVGMGFWLGNEDGVGDAIESPGLTFSAATFSSVISSLRPSSLTAGTVTTPSGAGTFRGSFIFQSRRAALDYVCDLYSCDWRVNGNATLDVGPSLFVTTPQAAVIARADGADMTLRALPGQAKLSRDTKDYTTRVVTVASGNGRTVAVGTADIAPGSNPYLDPQGAPVKMTRLVSESNTSLTNADARAQVALSQYTSPVDVVTLSSQTHDIRGDVAPGDSVWVFDEAAGLIDYDNEITFHGQRLWPVKLRVYQLTWPVEASAGVYFRTGAGQWIDLTDYVSPESGSQSTITVGGYNRSLTNSGSEPVGSRVIPDSSVPDIPTLGTITTSVYLSAGGTARARLIVPWTQPTNTDGTVISDGDHYEIQYRTPSGTGTWTSMSVGFDQTSATIVELTPATQYGLRIRAVDCATPPNVGAWSTEQVLVTAGDTIAPATPAAPTVAGNPLAIQLVHTLGKASGGTYNMDTDLAYFEVHASAVGSGYTPDGTTLLGKLIATYSMIAATVPAIGTFTTPSTSLLYVKVIAVDDSGNRSAASAAATVTATLIDSTYVTSLTATKIIAGDLSSTVGLLGLLRTATSGSRFEAGVNGSLNGARTYRPSGTLALNLDALTGDFIAYGTNGTTKTFRIEASTGNVYLYQSDGTTPALQLTASTGLIDMRGQLTTGSGVGVGPTVYVDPDLSGSPNRPRIKFYHGSGAKHSAVYGRVADDGTSSRLILANFDSATTFNGGIVEMDPEQVSLGFLTGTFTSGTQDTNAIIQLFRSTSSGIHMQGGGAYLDLNSGGAHVDSGGGSAIFGATANNYLNCTSSSSTLISGGTVKSFVIDHPIRDDKWLVHGCVEAPEAQVEYRGTALIADHLAVVELPSYFTAATRSGSESVHLTAELGTHDGMALVPSAAPSQVQDGRFHIVCPAPDGTRVHWLVKAARADVDPLVVEPLRADVTVAGDGPYRYLTPLSQESAA